MKKNINIDKKVIVGGTFDVLHKGHEVFLRRSFKLGKTTIGLTSNKTAEAFKKRKVRSFSLRKKDLENFIKKNLDCCNENYKIIKIEDKFGPTLKQDFDYIVVSPETYPNAVLINKKRQKEEKKKIKIIKINFVLAEDGKPISATRILKGKIDKRGKMIR